jgi:predicted SnoaL-like aldol condensation-catalyzing enzyme
MSLELKGKETVGAFLGAVMKNDPATMRQLANADYIQHNPHVPTGLEPFIGLLPVLQGAGTTAENVRMFQDGNYVFMHNLWHNAKPFGADEMVAFDVLRVDENGKVAEHWDAMTALVKQTASGRTQTDGPVKPTDLDKTEANKALARSMVEDILMGKNPWKDRRVRQRGQVPPAQPADQRRARRPWRGGGVPHLAEQHVQVHQDPQGAR